MVSQPLSKLFPQQRRYQAITVANSALGFLPHLSIMPSEQVIAKEGWVKCFHVYAKGCQLHYGSSQLTDGVDRRLGHFIS